MRLRILSVIGLALLLLCVTCPVRGATPDWTAVHGLSAGARVHVSLTSGKSLHGTIDHVSAAPCTYRIELRRLKSVATISAVCT